MGQLGNEYKEVDTTKEELKVNYIRESILIVFLTVVVVLQLEEEEEEAVFLEEEMNKQEHHHREEVDTHLKFVITLFGKETNGRGYNDTTITQYSRLEEISY